MLLPKLSLLLSYVNAAVSYSRIILSANAMKICWYRIMCSSQDRQHSAHHLVLWWVATLPNTVTFVPFETVIHICYVLLSL